MAFSGVQRSSGEVLSVAATLLIFVIELSCERAEKGDRSSCGEINRGSLGWFRAWEQIAIAAIVAIAIHHGELNCWTALNRRKDIRHGPLARGDWHATS